MIYLIQAGGGGPVKIGVAKDPQKRLRALQTAHSEKLYIRNLIPALHENERILHERLKEHQLMGEWFKPVDDVFWVFEACRIQWVIGPEYDLEFSPECNMSLSRWIWT